MTLRGRVGPACGPHDAAPPFMNLEKCVNVRISTKASKNEGSLWSPQIISSAISLKVSTSASRFAVVTVVVRATTSLSRRSSSRVNLSLRFTALSRFANISLPPTRPPAACTSGSVPLAVWNVCYLLVHYV